MALLFTSFSILPAQRTAFRLLTNDWVVGIEDQWGRYLPAANAAGDRFGFSIRENGAVTYESRVTRGASFLLRGQWEYFPRERTLVFYFDERVDRQVRRTRRRGFRSPYTYRNGVSPYRQPNRNNRFRSGANVQTYFVEKLSRDVLILRSQDGGRDFVLLSERYCR
ncbi:MAG: hypothetical protein AAF828_04825 [Bacteroidota bacterium]